MKIKPKEILVDLPSYFSFKDYHEIPLFAQNLNKIMHGKTKVKYEELGMCDKEYVGIFYLERNKEYNEFRSFVKNNILNNEYKDFIEDDEEPINPDLLP